MASEKSKHTEKKSTKGVFEFCRVCRINHNNGRRHNYFSSHTKSLSTLMSRFQNKLSHLRSSLLNPKLTRYQDGPPTPIWCVFCELDIDQHRSPFVSENAIRHLACELHLKNVKQFIWKYGGGTIKVDSFRFTEAELEKWEKKCEELKTADASNADKSDGSMQGHSTDIQPNGIMQNFDENNNFQFLESNISNNVKPLLYSTNENCQAALSDGSRVATFESSLCSGSSSFPGVMHSNLNSQASAGLAASSGQYSPFDGKRCSSRTHSQNGLEFGDQRAEGGSCSTSGFQNLTSISSRGSTDSKANVHTGAPPPWLHATEVADCNVQSQKVGVNFTHKSSGKSGKSSKLNPKRVGAAWAERRKIEIERERRGEVFSNVADADWLPNFGRVWQSGSRKESKKEFENAKQTNPDTETNYAAPIKIHPYVSKRMRTDTGSANGNADHTWHYV